MPCWIYLRHDGDDAIICNEAADVVLQRVEDASVDAFVHIVLVPIAHGDEPRTGYIRASEVVAVLPVHPKQYEAELDEPPDWYDR